MTYVVAIHTVSDPERFWGGAAEGIAQLPPGVVLHSTYPTPGGTRAVCLWEADSVDIVRAIVDGGSGHASSNDFFEVDTKHPATSGLPA
jgi:hypothetical protein